MLRSFRFVLSAVAVFALVGCRDVSLPDQPVPGSLIGTLARPDGGALENLEVLLEPLDGDPTKTASLADGTFSFQALTPGQWVLRVAPTDFVEVARPVSVAAGVQRNVGVIVMREVKEQSDTDGRIEGTVRIERDADPTGAEVTFTSKTTGQVIARVSVGASGRFSQVVPTGVWLLQASHPLYVSSPVLEVDVQPKALKDSQDLTMAINPAVLEGRLLREVDLSNQTLPAVGATVTTSSGGTATTDMDGRFRITGLPAGADTVTFTIAGFHDSVPSRTVRLVPEQTTTLPDVTLLLDRGDLTGEVEMADNTPLRDATASLDIVVTGGDAGVAINPYSAAVAPSAASPSRGAYLIKNVPVATYAVKVSRENYVTATSSGVLVEAGRTRDVGLLRLVRVQGDFSIDDGDSSNTPGFTRTTGVTLRLIGASSAIEYRVAEGDPTLNGVPFVAFGGAVTPTNIPFTLSSGDGTKVVYLQYRDAMNNVSGILTASMVLDTVAPSSPTLELEEGRNFTRSSLALLAGVSALDLTGMNVDVTSGVAWVRLSATQATDGGSSLPGTRLAYQPSLTFNRATVTDGVQVVYAQFIDNAGNESAIVSDSTVIDTQAPTGSFSISNGSRATASGYTHTQLVDLNFTAATEPNGGFVQVRIVNESAADLPNAVLQPMRSRIGWLLDSTDGLRTVRAMLVDAAGNATTLTERTITLDTTPPTAAASLVTPALSNSLLVTLQLAATDANPLSPTQALTLSEDPTFTGAGTTTPVAMPAGNQASFTLPAGDGPRRVFARVRDVAGNDAIANVQLTLDRSPPVGSISLAGALADGTASSTLTSAASVTVTLTQTGATLMQVGNDTLTTCATSASSYVAVASTLTNQALTGTATPRQVRVCLRDDAGNVTGPLSASITLDGTTPTGCLLSVAGRKVDGAAAPAGRTALRDVTVSVTGCSEPPTDIFLTESAVTCSAATPLSWVPFASTLAYSLTGSDGLATLRACVRDAARNTGATSNTSITLDTTPPSVAPTVSIDNGAAYVNAAQVTSRGGTVATITGTAAGATEWALSETSPPTSFVPITASTSFTFGGAGVRTVYALFRDDVGNTTPVASDSIEFDITPPAGAEGSGSPSIELTGELASGGTSTSLTATAAVTVELRVTGASEYVLGNEAMALCPSSGWLPVSTLTLKSQSLTGAANPRVMRACFRDAAGNVVGPFQDVITLDTTAPTNCTLTVNGFKRDATPAAANRTGLQDVTVSIAGCSEAPVDVYLTETTPTCVSTVSFPWSTFGSPTNFFLGSGDGTHTVRGCVRDAAGNVGAVVADDLVLDTAGPALPSLVINSGAAWINASQVVSGNVTLTLTGSATGATDWGVSATGTPSSFVPVATLSQSLTVSASPDGPRTVFGLFRDDLQNASTLASANITVDATPPSTTGMSIDIRSTGAAGYANSEVVTVAVAGSNDGSLVRLGERTVAGACTTADVSSAAAQAVLSSYTFALSPAEGTKRVCLRYEDAAGNASGLLEDTIVLDKTAPTVPQIVTPDQYVRLNQGAAFVVNIASPSVDTNFARYESLGGLASDGGTQVSWTTTTPTGTQFSFRLQNDGSETGVRNELRLRAVDLAGNASGESVVFVTADTNAPDPITWKPEWVDNGTARATMFWQNPSASTDLAGFRVFYGSTPGFSDSEAASFAAEGISPVIVPSGVSTTATLSSLPNGVPTYARIRPVDLAGNLGNWLPDAGLDLLRLQPGDVSLNELSVLSLPSTQASTYRLARSGNVLYVAATPASCNGDFVIHTIDLKQLPSPVQNGKVQATLDSPALVGSLVITDGASCFSGSNGELVVDGSRLYAMSTKKLHVLSLANPLAPALDTSIDLTALNAGASFNARGLAIMGDKAVISGQGGTFAYFTAVISLAALFDNNASTKPSVAGAQFFGSAGSSFMAGVTVRDRLVGFPLANFGATTAPVVNLSPAFAAVPSAPTSQGLGTMLTMQSRPPVSGNLFFPASTRSGLTVYDAQPLWAGGANATVKAATAYTGSGQMELLGHQLLMGDDSESVVRVLDLQTPTAPANAGRIMSGQSPRHVLGFGNNVVMTGGFGANARVWFYELATPRALRTIASTPGAGRHASVVDGFLHTGNGVTYDLLSSSYSPTVAGGSPGCSLGHAVAGEVEVVTRGDGFTVRKLDVATDRDGSTNAFTTYDVTGLTGSPRISDAAFWGNSLLLASLRPTGVFIEVCDARKLFNRGSTNMTAADCATSVQVASLSPGNGLTANLSVSQGRVAIGLDPTNVGGNTTAALGANLYFVDLSGLFDDDATTGAGAVQGPLTTHQVRQVVMQGNYAYAATASGMYVVDIKEVMDASSATSLPASPSVTRVLVNSPLDGVSVSGSLALTTPAPPAVSGSGISAIDVSTPLSAGLIGLYPMSSDTLASECTPVGDVSFRHMRAKVTTAGTRAYLTIGGTLQVLELE